MQQKLFFALALLLASVALVTCCPFSPDFLAESDVVAQRSTWMPDVANNCSVAGLGSSICACMNPATKHCNPGCGCLSESCNKRACAFPRVCFCELIKPSDESAGTSCSPVNSGPCATCHHNSTMNLNVAKATVRRLGYTPRPVLEWEYNQVSDLALHERCDKLNLLPAPTSGLAVGRHEMIELLIEYTILMESNKL